MTRKRMRLLPLTKRGRTTMMLKGNKGVSNNIERYGNNEDNKIMSQAKKDGTMMILEDGVIITTLEDEMMIIILKSK